MQNSSGIAVQILEIQQKSNNKIIHLIEEKTLDRQNCSNMHSNTEKYVFVQVCTNKYIYNTFRISVYVKSL